MLITTGPDAGTRIDLEDDQRVVVGTSPACDRTLTDRTVSRRHAAFEMRGAELHVVDLGSRNGTFVRGVRILEAVARDGHDVRVGNTTFMVEAVAKSSSMRPIANASHFGRTLGASLEMRRLYRRCQKLAASNVPIVVEGETGTGKEVLAESLHEASPRAAAPFVVFDCTAVSPSLMESHLFGHERGAFTGASSARRGVFELAHGGTLFIDEIGELDLSLQPKLLRAIQRGEVQRLGSEKWIQVDVRVIAATRRDLDSEVTAGRFRDDLFFRLAVGRIELPPLRRRRGDIALLTRHFFRALAGHDAQLPSGLVERFEDRTWPGNVRELQNAVARAVALAEEGDDLDFLDEAGPGDDAVALDATGHASAADPIETILAASLPFTRARDRILHEFTRRYVGRMLEQHGGNVTHAAQASGLARRYFQSIRARVRDGD